MTTAIDKVFSDGARHGPSTLIFGDFLQCEQRMWQVSKAFRNANRNALVHVGDQILLRGKAIQKNSALPEGAEERLPQLFEAISRKIGEIPPHNSSIRIGALWDALVEIHARLMLEPESERRSQRISTLVERLDAVNQALDAFLVAIRGRIPTEAAHKRLAESLDEIVMQDRLARRFEEAVQGRDLNPNNASQISACFAALFASQSGDAVRMNRPPIQQPSVYALPQFQKTEEHVFTLENLDQNWPLLQMWAAVRRRINAGPDADARSPAAVRRWMNDPANFPLLAQPRELEVQTHGQMPPEIGRMTGLRQLTWSGVGVVQQVLRSLPAEFVNLQHLEQLNLDRNAFNQIPPVLERLPNLEDLRLGGNQRPITRFPDVLERRLNSGWGYLVVLANNDAMGARRVLDFFGVNGASLISKRGLFNAAYAGLDYHAFNEIPFRVWFRENCSIPNIPLVIFTGVADWLGIGLKREEEAGIGCTVAELIALPAMMLSLVLSVPFLLINFALNLLVEPAITAVRDYFGYSRMVHVDREALNEEDQ